MLIPTKKIIELLRDENSPVADRLIITPILELENQAKLGQCSIDVRLGQTFRIPRRTKLDHLDHLDDSHESNIERYKDEQLVLLGDYFVLHPRQFVLGETLEWIHLPNNLAAYVVGRSSWGRDGLIIATATGIHSNYSGILTLELTNLGEIPIRLYPGLTIAQLFIHTVEPSDDEIPSLSSFAGSTAPESANAAKSDKAVLLSLRTMRGFDS